MVKTDANEKLAIKLKHIRTSNIESSLQSNFILAECVRVIVELPRKKFISWFDTRMASAGIFSRTWLKHALMFGCKLLQEYGSKFYDLQPSHNYVINGYGKILMTLVEMLSWEYRYG